MSTRDEEHDDDRPSRRRELSRADLRDAISRWTHGEDWRTWVAHGAIALVLTPIVGAKGAAGYYAIRESEQVFYYTVEKRTDKIDPLDHVMDVLAPAVAVAAAVTLTRFLRRVRA